MLLRQHPRIVREELQVQSNAAILLRANSARTLRPLNYAETSLKSYASRTAMTEMGPLHYTASRAYDSFMINDSGIFDCNIINAGGY